MKNEWVINHHDVIAMRDSAEYIMTMTYEENQSTTVLVRSFPTILLTIALLLYIRVFEFVMILWKSCQ